MSKFDKQVTEHVVTKKMKRCDMCGEEYEYVTENDGAEGSAWALVRAHKNCRYDDCWSDRAEYDFCLKCWDEKVEPALEALGVKKR